MKNVILEAKRRESILLAVALVFACMFVACSGNGNSSAPDSIADLSSSSSDDEFSQKDDSSSSVDKKSSSSEQGNSSVGGKSSSSSAVESSSSFKLEPVCEDGETTIDEAFGMYIYETCRDGFWEADSSKSKSVVDSLAAIEKNKEHPNMDSLFAGYDGEYFEFEDPRDGHKYKYIEFHGYTDDIGSHATFYVMAENLNYGKMVPSGTTKFDDKVTEKLCYVDDEWFCDNHFGGLYSWAEAMNLPKVCDSVAVDSNEACKAITEKRGSYPGEEYLNIIWQGICPDGWHIMNQREWRYARGDIRSKILWEKNAGRNADGLAVIPTGNYYPNGLFTGVREHEIIWIPAEESSTGAYDMFFSSVADDRFLRASTGTKGGFQSVRCVMDANNTLIH